MARQVGEPHQLHRGRIRGGNGEGRRWPATVQVCTTYQEPPIQERLLRHAVRKDCKRVLRFVSRKVTAKYAKDMMWKIFGKEIHPPTCYVVGTFILHGSSNQTQSCERDTKATAKEQHHRSYKAYHGNVKRHHLIFRHAYSWLWVRSSGVGVLYLLVFVLLSMWACHLQLPFDPRLKILFAKQSMNKTLSP